MNEIKAHIEKRIKEEQDNLDVAIKNNDHALILFWTWALEGTKKLQTLIQNIS